VSEPTNREVEIAKKILVETGHVVLRAKSHQDAQRRYAIATSEAQWYRDELARTQRWAEQDLGAEIRRLRDRCTFLYGAARVAGCTPQQLATETMGGAS
jgi:hypothetical protein